MPARTLTINDNQFPENILQNILDALQAEQLIIFPTETVYGIACDALNPNALLNLVNIKKRPPQKPFPIMTSGIEQAMSMAEFIHPKTIELLEKYWPGPLTVVLPSKLELSACVMNHDETVALRCPNHPIPLKILKKYARPLAVPSANINEQPPPTSKKELEPLFANETHLAFKILQDADTTKTLPSTIVQLLPNAWKILRYGPISIDEITSILGKPQ